MTTVQVQANEGCDGAVTVVATLVGAAPGETHTITSASSYGSLWGDTSGHVVTFTGTAATFTVPAQPGTYTVHVTLGVDGVRETNGDATVVVQGRTCETTTTSTAEETTTTSGPTLSVPPITVPPIVESSVPIVAPPTTEVGDVFIGTATSITAATTSVTVPITLPKTGAHADINTGAMVLGGGFLVIGMLLVAARRRLA